jgi:hypothetical protein
MSLNTLRVKGFHLRNAALQPLDALPHLFGREHR